MIEALPIYQECKLCCKGNSFSRVSKWIGFYVCTISELTLVNHLMHSMVIVEKIG